MYDKPGNTPGDLAIQAVIHLVQHMKEEPDWLGRPDDGDWLRSSLEALADAFKATGDTEREKKIRDVLWEPLMLLNSYECECGQTWTDEWTCACDDECPRCGTDTSPYESEVIFDDTYDKTSSASRQHFIDTGRYLKKGDGR